MKISASAEVYAWRELARRAGIHEESGFEGLGVPIHYSSLKNAIASPPALIVCRAVDSAWNNLLSLRKQDLRWIPVSEVVPPGSSIPFKNAIPVLFWGEHIDGKTQPFAKRLANGSIVFHADILATTLFMLTRWEETVSKTKDKHSRFAAVDSVAYKLGFLDIPIVDQYALILREWLKLAVPHWVPQQNTPAINLTHDIDHVYQYANLLSVVRALGSAFTSKRPLHTTHAELKALWMQLFDSSKGERYRAIYSLASHSKAQGFKSRFYFMSGKASLKQQGYNPDNSLVQEAFRFLQHYGHEIGFHPGYSTFGSPSLLAQERDRLERALNGKVIGGRQHFLRFRVPHTWRHWEQVGLEYDSTLGYADHEGFRCGTCHSYQPFDLEEDRVIGLREIPLIVMDTTLIEYRRMTIEGGRKAILELARKCTEVEGVFTLLWHNVTLVGRYLDWGSMYIETLPYLKELIEEQQAC
jgi:hypothetical protein